LASLIAVTSPSSTAPTTTPQGALATASSTQPAIVEYISTRIANFHEATTVDEPKIKKEIPLSISEHIDVEAKSADIDPTLAHKIAFCESTLRQFNNDGTVVRGVRNSSDIGLFQINEKFHLEKSRELGYDIYTTQGNIDYALYLLKKEGSRHWSSSKPCWSKDTQA